MPPKRLRNFCFTLSNYTDEEVRQIRALSHKYLIFGYEIAPTTKTPHLQGYCELDRQTSFSVIHEKFPRMHIEARIGTAAQAAEYCKKEKNFEEYGIISHQGKSSVLFEVSQMIAARETTVSEIAHDFPGVYAQWHKGLHALQGALVPTRTEPPLVIWLFGRSGVGKTREAFGDGQDVYIHTGTKWFDGYFGQRRVVFDDMTLDTFPFDMLLRLLDRYPVRVEVKGGMINFSPEQIYITTSWNPHVCYTERQYEQISRRCKEIREIIRN